MNWFILAALIIGVIVVWLMCRDSSCSQDATGLGRFGRVRVLEPAHTQPNFVMREMGYQIARKHAEKLRILATAGLFVVPAVCLLMLLVAAPSAAALVGLVAVLSMVMGVLVERWLFFAQAKHIVMLYYGEEAI